MLPVRDLWRCTRQCVCTTKAQSTASRIMAPYHESDAALSRFNWCSLDSLVHIYRPVCFWSLCSYLCFCLRQPWRSSTSQTSLSAHKAISMFPSLFFVPIDERIRFLQISEISLLDPYTKACKWDLIFTHATGAIESLHLEKRGQVGALQCKL